MSGAGKTSAASERASLAAIGCDLVAREGGPGARRGASLLRRLNGSREENALALDDLPRVPRWARLPRIAQQRLAAHAALASIANDLAQSIDGGWLGGHAAEAGDDAVDWAIGLAGKAPALPAIEGEQLADRGFALLSATLDDGLQPLLAWAPAPTEEVPHDAAAECVKLAIGAAS